MAISSYLSRIFKQTYRRLPSNLTKLLLWIRSIKKLAQSICQSGFIRALWVLNYVEDTLGGREAYKCRLPVDRYKCPLPWYTYPAIEYLQQLDFSECDVFEFGSGNSSKFWSERAHTVTSVESDPYWYDAQTLELPSNLVLLFRTDMEEYVNAIHHQPDKFYDVIIIDGRYRYNCAVEALKRLKNGGIIILDNSDWFPNTAKLLRDNGFTQIDFIGIGPINSYAWCTSIFFKEQLSIPRASNALKVLGGLIQVSNEDRYIVRI
jgi:hypothetical protein